MVMIQGKDGIRPLHLPLHNAPSSDLTDGQTELDENEEAPTLAVMSRRMERAITCMT